MSVTLQKPAKSLLKNPTDQPIVLKNVTGMPMDDPIIKFAAEIEKVKTRAQVEEIIKEHNDARQFELFKLGGAIAVAQQLFDKSKFEFEGYKNFGEYVEMVHGIRYDNAMAAARIYKKLVQLEIPRSAFKKLGWTKVRMLLDVVTKENVNEWVAKAEGMNCPSLKALVEAEKQKGKSDTEQEPKTITTKTFKLHPDQKQVSDDAIAKAKQEGNTEHDSVAYEYICQSYVGGGLAFSTWDQGLTYASKQSDDPQVFAQKVVTRLKQLFPQLDIAVEITLKEPAAAA